MTVRDTIDRYYAAMRAGPNGENDLMALFAADAVYDEPFSGLEPARGREAIRRRLRSGWKTPLPDMELDVLSVSVTGQGASCRWECRSAAFDTPRRGHDRYRFRDGLITELTVTLE